MRRRIFILIVVTKTSLKIPKGQSESYIEEQTTQWPKEIVQKDKQRSTKHTYKTKDWVTRTPLKTGGELRISFIGSKNVSVNLLPNPMKLYILWSCCNLYWKKKKRGYLRPLRMLNCAPGSPPTRRGRAALGRNLQCVVVCTWCALESR